MKNFMDEKNARTASVPFWPISVPQRVGYGLANFVPLRVWVSCCRPSRGIYFLAEQPSGDSKE